MTLIDRDKLLMRLADYQLQESPNWGANGQGNADAYEAITACIEAVENAETIDAEPVRHGQWIGIEYDGEADGNPVYDVWECSECGHEHNGDFDTLTDYCPNCGADMRSRNDGEK